MSIFEEGKKLLFGMVHLRALPGTPRAEHSVARIAEIAAEETRVLAEAGFDGAIVENMHDTPYLRRSVGPEVVASMTAAALAVREAAEGRLKLGVQTLAGANREALAIAQAAGFDFIRAEGFIFGHVGDEGYFDSDAGELLRYRKAIGADGVEVFADIKKKHSAHAITADVSLTETAKAAEFFLADGVIVTGSSTGEAASEKDAADVAKATDLPVLIGSGLTPENLLGFDAAAGFIVGSALKRDGHWTGELDRERCEAFVKAFREQFGRP
jgi:hypothetical protein